MSKIEFNNIILKAVHRLLNDQELEHIDGNTLMYYITTEIEYRCDEAVELIYERHQSNLEYEQQEE